MLVLTLVILFPEVSLVRGEADLGHPCARTPYDGHFQVVREVFAHFKGQSPSVSEVRSLLLTARRFQYFFNWDKPFDPQPPEVTESRQEGDCKAKSLWLASKMGDRSTRYVVGMGSTSSKMAHCWLLWANDGRWLALDPTLESDVLYADRIVGRKLFARFSYTANSQFVHPTFYDYFPDGRTYSRR